MVEQIKSGTFSKSNTFKENKTKDSPHEQKGSIFIINELYRLNKEDSDNSRPVWDEIN